MDFPIPLEFWWSTDILSSSIFLQGVDQKILPFGQGRIDSVKINPSLLMMRELNIIEIHSNQSPPKSVTTAREFGTFLKTPYSILNYSNLSLTHTTVTT